MNYPEVLRERYNEVMFDERDIIEKFLKDQYDIRYGRQRDTWHFEPAVEVVAHQGSLVQIHDIKLDKDKFVVFYVEAFCEMNEEWECSDFAYGELSKVIEALPDAKQIVIREANSDIAQFCSECSVNLEENPFVTKLNGKDVSIYEVQYEDGRVISYDKEGRIVSDEYSADFHVGLRDHINIEVLHRSEEYKRIIRLLAERENLSFECANYGDATFVIEGTDMTFDVSSIHRDDQGYITIYGNDIDANDCDGIKLEEENIKPSYLTSIIELLEKDMYGDIIDTYNAHDEELVRKINAAWNDEDYHDKFGDILLAIGRRDKKEIAKKLDCETDNYETAMANAHEILQHICDDQDLETILSFIRYKE